MTENAGKKFVQTDNTLLSGLLPKSNSDLNFSKGFTYQNQNLDNVHNSAEEVKKMNRDKVSKYIGEEIIHKKLTENEIKTHTDSMTVEQARRFNQKAQTDEYDLNTLYAYIDHRDEWKNPNADGIGMFEKRGSAASSINREPYAWGVGVPVGREMLGRGIEGVGNYQFNKTMDKYLPEDVARLTRYTKYENVPEVLSEKLAETNEQIKKAEQRLGKSVKNKLINGGVNEETRKNLEELYARRDSIKESLEAIESTKKKLPSEEPETARETAKRMKLKGSDLKAAGQASVKSSVYYTTEIAPMYKQVKETFNMGNIFDSLTKEDFPGLTESERNDMKEVISKEKAAYSKYDNISAEELHKKLGDFDLSKQRIKGEDSKGLTAQFKDAVHTKINNILDDAVERELPGQGIKNKKLTYNNMLNIENELKDYAVSGGKRKSQSMLKDLKDGTTRSIKIKRGLGTNLKTVGKFRPSTFLNKVIDWFKKEPQKVVEKGKEIVENGTESPTVKKITENKKLANPKAATQPNLFGSSMDFATVALGDILEMGGLESPLEILTEIVSYALETNKLNKENGTNLPLYDEGNSYVNQNPYNGLTLEERMKLYREKNGLGDAPELGLYLDESIYDQDWYKALLEEEEKSNEKYKELLEDADIEKILNSLK